MTICSSTPHEIKQNLKKLMKVRGEEDAKDPICLHDLSTLAILTQDRYEAMMQ